MNLLEKYKTPIEKEHKIEWLKGIIERGKLKEALLQFEESSQLNENLFFIAMYFLRNVIEKVNGLDNIFTLKEIKILCEFLDFYDKNDYVMDCLIFDGIFPSKEEKEGIN